MPFENDYDSDDDSDWEPITDDSSHSSSDEDWLEDSSTTPCRDHNSTSSSDNSAVCSESMATKEELAPSQVPWRSFTRAAKACAVLLPLLVVMNVSFPTADFNGEESIYVPGVGFSGFWFTLGRLKSIKDPASKDYVCFSAGCLGAVTILNEFSVDEMACMAETAQTAWRSGEIGRFDVVSQFVDGLVYRNFPSKDDPLNCLGSLHGGRNSSIVPINNPRMLSKLHILTTEKATGFGVKKAMRSPATLDELREMLIQTSWIPIATGNALMHNGHMDGGFSLWQHPRCAKSVNLPLDPGLILNSLNVNMGRSEAYRLWHEGLAYGL